MSENAKKVIHNIQIIWPHFRMDPSGLSSVCAVPCLCREMAPQGLSGTRGRFHKSFCALRPTFMPYAQLFEKLFTGVKVGRRAWSWAQGRKTFYEINPRSGLTIIIMYVTNFSSISYNSNVRLKSKIELEQDLQSIA